MQLAGWDYVGRNIDESLHTQFRMIVECLSDASFVKGRVWSSRDLQEDLAQKLGNSDGQIRTLKRVFEDLGLVKKGSLNRTNVLERSKFMSSIGEKVYYASCLEKELNKIPDKNKKESARNHIKGLYEEGYCIAMANYFYESPDKCMRLHPLRATLKALQKYGSMDKWEWYLLNTDIREDDNTNQENLLNQHIKEYRNGVLTFSMKDVIRKPKGHQYLPQFLQFAGLVNLQNGRYWRISDNGRRADFKSMILSPTFLTDLYKGENA